MRYITRKRKGGWRGRRKAAFLRTMQGEKGKGRRENIRVGQREGFQNQERGVISLKSENRKGRTSFICWEEGRRERGSVL